jgi:hypothetical protein
VFRIHWPLHRGFSLLTVSDKGLTLFVRSRPLFDGLMACLRLRGRANTRLQVMGWIVSACGREAVPWIQPVGQKTKLALLRPFLSEKSKSQTPGVCGTTRTHSN